MEAQRAPAYRLCSELSRGALEGRGVLARQSGHRCHRGLQLGTHNTKGHCHPRASSAKTRGFHTQLDEGPETPRATREASGVPFLNQHLSAS